MRTSAPHRPSGLPLRRGGWLVLLLLLAAPGRISAQERPDRFHRARPPASSLAAPQLRVLPAPGPAAFAPAAPEPDSSPTLARLVGAGLLGGAVGVVAGGYLGARLGNDRCGAGEECFAETISGAAVGLLVGESLLLSLGVHLANRRQGRYLPAAATATGIAVGGLGLLHLTHFDPPWAPAILVAVPALQLGTAITIERP